MTIDDVERKQAEFDGRLGAFQIYTTKKREYIEVKKWALE